MDRKVAPSRGRGSKLFDVAAKMRAAHVAPSRGRGSKPLENVPSGAGHESPLHGGADRNIREDKLPEPPLKAPPRGGRSGATGGSFSPPPQRSPSPSTAATRMPQACTMMVAMDTEGRPWESSGPSSSVYRRLIAKWIHSGPNEPSGFILTTILGIGARASPPIWGRPSAGITQGKGPASSAPWWARSSC